LATERSPNSSWGISWGGETIGAVQLAIQGHGPKKKHHQLLAMGENSRAIQQSPGLAIGAIQHSG